MLLKDKAAGKLYVIGEYNVLKSGHSALIAPVNLYIEASLKKSKELLIIRDKDATINLNSDDVPHNLVFTATTINLFHQYLVVRNIEQQNFTLTITNNLKAAGKLKYGLGSSGASIVLIVKLLNQFYKTALDNLAMLKFSILVQKHLNKYSSGGDLAASLFDEPVLYTRYDKAWLESVPFSFDLLDTKWPLLNIKVIKNLPTFAIGWTKETFKPDISKEIEQEFFIEAEKLVQQFALSFDTTIIESYQNLLNDIAKTRPGMITPKLEVLIKTSKKLGINAKISGAGYGDSGIALVKTEADKKNLQKVWAENDIILLDVWRK